MKRSVAFCLGLVLPIISSAHAADWPFTNKQAQAEATNANSTTKVFWDCMQANGLEPPDE